MPQQDHRKIRREDHIGRMRCIAAGEGYVMVRRPSAMPFVMCEDDWLALPPIEGDRTRITNGRPE